MAEMVGLSRGLRHRNGAIGSFVVALKLVLARLNGNRRSAQLRPEEWSDYLLRDIGLDNTIRDELDPRASPTDWLTR